MDIRTIQTRFIDLCSAYLQLKLCTELSFGKLTLVIVRYFFGGGGD
jgi:hypothetical protein